MPFRHDARKSSPKKKVGGIFFGERECERTMVGRNMQQVPLRQDKGRLRRKRRMWLAGGGLEAGCEGGTEYKVPRGIAG
ncbi:hypothetical protein V8C37DRAFT_393519 [Trichoderma ceciliae]